MLAATALIIGREASIAQEITINTVTAQPPIDFQILDPFVVENPYPFYDALLAQAPVYRVPNTDVYLVSSWKLIHEVLKNQPDYSANLTGILIRGEDGGPQLFDFSVFGGTVNAIANADEPFHSVHRKLVLPQLNARKVAAMEDEVQQWVSQGVAELLETQGGDCVGQLANAIPVMVMARLLGLPVEDVDILLDWAFSGGDILAGTIGAEQLAELGVATGEMSAYLQRHFEGVAARGNIERPANVTEELAQGVAQGLISESDAVSIMVVLVGAAGESTSSLVGSAIRMLAQDENLQQRLRDTPQDIDRFIEEVVRMESPFKGHYRAVLNDTELGGVAIPRDARVYLLWAAANRDPAVFPQPATLDIDRDNMNEHLGFGHGIHFCIGARLARMEAKIILRELLGRTARFSIDPAHPVQHVNSIFVRRLGQLHLRLDV